MPVVKVTKTVLAQTYIGVVFIRSVSDTIFAISFLPKRPQTTWRTAAVHSLRNTGLDSIATYLL
jgi:hypothetical protein